MKEILDNDETLTLSEKAKIRRETGYKEMFSLSKQLNNWNVKSVLFTPFVNDDNFLMRNYNIIKCGIMQTNTGHPSDKQLGLLEKLDNVKIIVSDKCLKKTSKAAICRILNSAINNPYTTFIVYEVLYIEWDKVIEKGLVQNVDAEDDKIKNYIQWNKEEII